MIERLFGGWYPARPLAVTRWVVGAGAAIRALVGIPILVDIARPDSLHMPYAPWQPELTPAIAWLLIAVWLAAAVAFTIGWHSRPAGAVLVAAMASVLVSDQQAYGNHLYLLTLLALLLTLADAGAALSLDARRRGERPSVPGWPVSLLRIQLTLVYGFSALTKLNEDFLSGAVLAGSLQTGPITFPAGLRTPAVLSVVAAVAIAVEALLALALWSTRLRPAAVGAGVVFHLSIVALIGGATGELVVFSLEMWAVYLLFVAVPERSLTLMVDPACGWCRRWDARLRRWDIIRALAVPEPAGHDVPDSGLELTGRGLSAAGYDAIVEVWSVQPATYLLAPFLRLPGIRKWGQRTVRRRGGRSRLSGGGRSPDP